ncbi:MAG: hypothetical protein HYZ42_00280 [Bacteroidetes bacterium]|nr:hypothetical protein [Bacteroidota bacterium]
MSTIIKCFFVALFATTMFGTAFAQTPLAVSTSSISPDRQFGIGVTVGVGNAAHVCYAISPAFHLGAQLGIDLHSTEGTSTNSIYFAPYGKFIMSGMKDLKPYFFGSFQIQSGNGTSTALSLGAGGEYFASRNVGIYGQISILRIGFDPSVTDIGIVFPQVGVEWFFNP